MNMQTAELKAKDGHVERVQVPAFPGNPELIVVPEGMLAWGLTSIHYFVADSPVIGLGTTELSYREVSAYEPVDAAKEKP
jgi:hypothetical protein